MRVTKSCASAQRVNGVWQWVQMVCIGRQPENGEIFLTVQRVLPMGGALGSLKQQTAA